MPEAGGRLLRAHGHVPGGEVLSIMAAVSDSHLIGVTYFQSAKRSRDTISDKCRGVSPTTTIIHLFSTCPHRVLRHRLVARIP